MSDVTLNDDACYELFDSIMDYVIDLLGKKFAPVSARDLMQEEIADAIYRAIQEFNR